MVWFWQNLQEPDDGKKEEEENPIAADELRIDWGRGTRFLMLEWVPPVDHQQSRVAFWSNHPLKPGFIRWLHMKAAVGGEPTEPPELKDSNERAWEFLYKQHEAIKRGEWFVEITQENPDDGAVTIRQKRVTIKGEPRNLDWAEFLVDMSKLWHVSNMTGQRLAMFVHSAWSLCSLGF